MKKSKRLISLFLAALIAFSGMAIGFTAVAVENEERSEAVSAVETEIADWYNTHRNNLYSTKDETAKAAARAAYDEVSKAVSALTDDEKLQLGAVYYSYWLQVVSADVARNLSADPSKSPSTQQKVDVAVKNLGDIEAVIGKLPEDYKKVLDAFDVYNTQIGNVFFGNSSKVDYKNNEEAQSVLAKLIESVKDFSEKQLNFSDYISINTTGGFYFGQSSLSEKYGTTMINILNYSYYEAQDLNTASGADPKSFSYTTYVQRSGTAAAGYSYSWKAGKDAEAYVNDFNTYSDAVQSDIIAQCDIAEQKVLDIVDSMDAFKGIKDAANAVKEIGIKLINGETVSVADVNDALNKYNALSDKGKRMFDSLAGTGNFKVVAIASNIYTADDLTPELAYTAASRVTQYKLSDCKNQCNDVLYQLMLEEFTELVRNTDLNNLNDSVINSAKEKYVALPAAFKKQITAETMAKYTQIVKPASDDYNFAKEVNGFKQTQFTRPENSEVAWTTGGIQSAVDELWNLVANTLVPLIAKDVDLSNGLDNVLEKNVYTNEMVAKIFSLYASLSRDETDLGVAGMTLGKVINMLCSPSNIAKFLEEDKYSSVAATIKEYNDFVETEDTNKLEALATHKFANGDFGFNDGDREGFIDALLAVLRPITTLLAPGAKALGLISLDINMFDYIDGDGNYVEGVYAKLIPLLEQLGCTDLMTVEEYKDNYYLVANDQTTVIAADEFLKPVINSVLKNVLDVVSPDPLNGLIKILPRLAHIVNTDMLDTSVKAALSQMGMLSGLAGSLDLSKDFINSKLAQPIDLSGLTGSPLTITLPPIDWAKLADCCTVQAVKSSSNSNDYFVLRTGDTDSAFSTVFYYIYQVVFADADVYAAVRKLVTDNLGGLASMVTNYTDAWVRIGAVDTYGEVLELLGTPTGDEIEKPSAPVDPENPDDPSNPDKPNNGSNSGSSSVIDKIKDLLGIGGNKDDKNDKDDKNNSSDRNNSLINKKNTKNPLIPKTGGEETAVVMTAVYAVLAVAIVSAAVVYKKRKHSEAAE